MLTRSARKRSTPLVDQIREHGSRESPYLSDNARELLELFERAQSEAAPMLLMGGGLLSFTSAEVPRVDSIVDTLVSESPDVKALEEATDSSDVFHSARLDWITAAYCLGLAVGLKVGGGR